MVINPVHWREVLLLEEQQNNKWLAFGEA